MGCLDRENCSAVYFLCKKGTVPKDSPLWRIVLNSEQVGRYPAAVFKLYPVIAVSSAVDAFAICVAGVSIIQVIPSAVACARGSCDNCDIPQKTVNSRVFEV